MTDSLKGGPGAGSDSCVRSVKEALQYPMMDELLATFEAAVFPQSLLVACRQLPGGGIAARPQQQHWQQQQQQQQ